MEYIETDTGDPIRLLNLDTGYENPGSLTLHEANPRQGDVGALCVSYKQNGFYGRVIVNKSDMRVLAGNHRVKAALALGMERIPVEYIHTDGDLHAIKILIADNRHSDLADYDKHLLAELLQTVAHSDLGLDGTGYDGDDLDGLLYELGLDAPNFQPVGIDEQGKLDEKAKTMCPECGHEFEA